jgi:hypothetical protein
LAREGVHAVQPAGELLAPLQVGVQRHLGVALRAEFVPATAQLGTQLPVVVDLAAVGGGQQGAAVPVDRHGLLAALDVDHGQPAVSESDVVVQPDAGRVRTAAGHGLGHGGEDAVFLGQVPVK